MSGAGVSGAGIPPRLTPLARALPSRPPLRTEPARPRRARRPGGSQRHSTREGREGGPRCPDLEGAGRSVRAWVSLFRPPPPPPPLRAGRRVKAAVQSFLPGAGGRACGRAVEAPWPRGSGPALGLPGRAPLSPSPVVRVGGEKGAPPGLGFAGVRGTLFIPAWGFLGGLGVRFLLQRRTASGREPVTRATRPWNSRKNSTLTATSLAAGASRSPTTCVSTRDKSRFGSKTEG